jgi:RNA polymerase sigma-70 factor (ECF subfamily)
VADDDTHLSQIATRWSLLWEANGNDPAHRSAARGELLLRYVAPVYRYLRAVVRDSARAEDLCQEFALRFLRGDFRHADPNRGRFRNYLKSALCHLAAEEAKRERGRFRPLSEQLDTPVPDADDCFVDLWRSGLIDRTWNALAQSSKVFYETLRMKSNHPDHTSAMLAEELTRCEGRHITAESARQTLHRARERFAELLRAEVAASIPTDDPAVVDAELADLGLLVYCPPVENVTTR